ncbi:MAG: hypothetical protein B7Y93_03360 [Micrococcales bacterium 32-70-13]|nr:MAG: hypothetical protein B7Y93_03360 [Micrococcales bacterium 32-70-13]
MPWLETFQISIGESLGESIDESIVSECGVVDRGCAHAASVLPCSDTEGDGTYALVERSHPPEVEVSTITRMRRILDFPARARDDRGDVPGWVLITLMTAGLVILIWALAGPALQGVFQQAIDRVTGF